jgi:hypothetical protein
MVWSTGSIMKIDDFPLPRGLALLNEKTENSIICLSTKLQ